MLSALFLALVVTLCHWDDLPKAADAQPLAAVAPKDAAGPPVPPASPAPAPAPAKPAPAPVQAAPVKPVVATPVKPAPVKPAPPQSTAPIVVRTRPSGTTTTERPRLQDGQKPSGTTLTVRTDADGHVVSMEVTTTAKAAPAELKPHNQGGGHHVPAKRAFEGAPNYDAKKALAIPNAELARLGMDHKLTISPAQHKEYVKFAKTNQPLTWTSIAQIETEVLIKSGMTPDIARATVAKAIQALKDAGVPGPIRIPWGN